MTWTVKSRAEHHQGGAGPAALELESEAPESPGFCPPARRAPGVSSASYVLRTPQPPGCLVRGALRACPRRARTSCGAPGRDSWRRRWDQTEDERRKAAQKLTRVGAPAPGRRRDEPDRGDALAECTRRAERAQVGLSSRRCAPLRVLAGRRMGPGAQGPCPPLLPLSPPRARRPAGALRSWTAAPGWRRRAPGL
ncbi:hypothetical protein AB1E18_003528 [Capra hircus]